MNTEFNYFWEPEEFITGDNIESLGNFIFDVGNYLTGDHERIKTHKSEQQLIDEQIEEINIKQPNIIYCYGHDTYRLLNNIDRIKNSFKLITHNSDIGILPEFTKYIENEKIIKWYGQNNHIKHNKTVTLPIAIARKKYQHGDVNLLSLLSRNTNKKYLYYKNFDIHTNTIERTICNDITTRNGILMSDRCSQIDYMTNISQSLFVISPPGNGIDCHRIWECLYLKTIPVVKYHSALEQFKDLPILFIDDWNCVTPDFLNNKKNLINDLKYKINKLHFQYWKHIIVN